MEKRSGIKWPTIAGCIGMFVYFAIVRPVARNLARFAPGTSSQQTAMSATWATFHSPEGRYTVDFPGASASQTKQVDLGLAEPLIMRMRLCASPNEAFGVSYIDWPAGMVDNPTGATQNLDSSQARITRLGGTVVSVEKISIQGNSAREMVWRSGRGPYGRGRSVITGNRAYNVTVLSNRRADCLSADADRFLDSFRISE